MKALIITNIENTHTESKVNSLLETLKNHEISAEVRQNNGLLYEIKDGIVVPHIPDCDFILYLDKDIYTSVALEKCGYRVFPKSEFTSLCDNKILTNLTVSDLGLKVVDSMSLPLVFHSLSEENYKVLDTAIDKYGLPLVLKKAYGSLGEGVYKIDSKEELYLGYQIMYKEPLLIQPYIPTFNSSIRVLVVNHEILGAIKRVGYDDFRSNSGSTTSVYYPLDKDLMTQVNILITNLDIDYAGVDFIVNDKGEYLFLEINSNAFYDEFASVTGIDVGNLYIEMILEELKDENI